MKATVFAAHKLPPVFDERWRQWQQSDPALRSPYFRPEFTRMVASVRKDVFVAVIEDGEGFFPFQRDRFGIGRPVGALMSDYHGVIARPGFSYDALQLVRRCGLRVWNFGHVPAAQTQFEPWHRIRAESPVINLRRGPIGSAQLRQQVNNRRNKLERAIGPLEWEMHSGDPAGLRQLIAWKSAQCRRAKRPDLFSKQPWTCRLLEAISTCREDLGFGSVLSTLRAGRRVVAAHFGMRSHRVLHWWFPVYDVELADFSPGLLFLRALIEVAAEHGFDSIDLGRGAEPYKRRFANEAVPLLEGSVVAALWITPLLHARRAFRRMQGSLNSLRLSRTPSRG